jgi:hypothetical protein
LSFLTFKARWQAVSKAEYGLKVLLWVFGGVSVIATFPFVMPWSWMGVVHEWLGMGALPDKPVVEYLARSTSAMCALYGGVLLILATDVRRYAAVIRFQAIAIMALSAVGAVLGLKGGMPAWWMIGDAGSVWLFSGTMLVLQRNIARAPDPVQTS